MRVAYSKNRKPQNADADIADVAQRVLPRKLREYVEMLAFPRHYVVEKAANIRARDLLLRVLDGFGYAPVLQGAYDNIVATSSEQGPYILLGAHYDSVPGSPGADDGAANRRDGSPSPNLSTGSRDLPTGSNHCFRQLRFRCE